MGARILQGTIDEIITCMLDPSSSMAKTFDRSELPSLGFSLPLNDADVYRSFDIGYGMNREAWAGSRDPLPQYSVTARAEPG